MPASVNRELSVLKRAFNLAISWGMTDENPVQKVKFLRQPEPRERILAEDEEMRLFEACTEHLKPNCADCSSYRHEKGGDRKFTMGPG
jgi:site-specific recombinase XerD